MLVGIIFSHLARSCKRKKTQDRDSNLQAEMKVNRGLLTETLPTCGHHLR